MTITQTEFGERRQDCAGELEALELDALVISSLPSVRYLSGFTGSNALLMLNAGGATLYTDPRYDIQAREETTCRVQVVSKGSIFLAAAKQAARKKWKSIGFESQHLNVSQHAEVRRDLPATSVLKPVSGLVERQRSVKSLSEVELIRDSVLTNSKAFERAIPQIRPSMRESELAALLEYEMRRLGAEKASFDTIVASGPRTALPHAHPATEELGTNRLLLIDMGALRSGYASDMTRTLHVGKPSAQARKMYKAVLEAQLAAINTVRAGVAARAVDRAARSTLKKHGLEKEFIHSTGHGLGLEIHELPRLGRAEPTRLEAGMVITIEPGAYVAGFGGVRIEDTVLVTQTGCEILTPTSKEFTII